MGLDHPHRPGPGQRLQLHRLPDRDLGVLLPRDGANGCTSVDSVAVCPRNISCGSNKVQICHNVGPLWLLAEPVHPRLASGQPPVPWRPTGSCGSQANCLPRSNNGHGNGSCKTGDDAAAAADAECGT
ncbi:MAG: hypothetical protein U0176_07570 [Bacteroidia bacterium]